MTTAGHYWVVGTSGSGKSTLAGRISTQLGLPHVELDAHHHQPGWTSASPEQLRTTVTAALAAAEASAGGWVVDGNYQSTLGDLLAQRADTVIWLDYPRWLVMGRLLRRTVTRVVTRRELWNGNRESWRNLARREPELNILLWAWTTHARNHQRYLERSAGAVQPWLRLRSPREARSWLARQR